MADEWLSSLALAAALSTHARIGRDSMLGRLDTELLRMIVEKVNEGTGIKAWRWVQLGEDTSLVDFTTLRHTVHGTTVQLSHGASSGIYMQASDRSVPLYIEEGEFYESAMRSTSGVDDIKVAGGCLVPEEGVKTGPWELTPHGPDIMVTRADRPSQIILLTGDGIEVTPAIPAACELFGLPPPPSFRVMDKVLDRSIQRNRIGMASVLLEGVVSCTMPLQDNSASSSFHGGAAVPAV